MHIKTNRSTVSFFSIEVFVHPVYVQYDVHVLFVQQTMYIYFLIAISTIYLFDTVMLRLIGTKTQMRDSSAFPCMTLVVVLNSCSLLFDF